MHSLIPVLLLFAASVSSTRVQEFVTAEQPVIEQVAPIKLPAPPDVYPASRFDFVLELNLSAEQLTLESEVRRKWLLLYDGGLNIWAESDADVDLALHVFNDNSELLAEDNDSGGGRTPFLRFNVERLGSLNIAISLQEPAELIEPIRIRLHLIASLESNATRVAAQATLTAVEDAKALLEQGSNAASSVLLGKAISNARLVKRGEWSEAIADALWSAGLLSYESGDIANARAAWGSARAHWERSLPREHPGLQDPRHNLALTLYSTGELEAARALQERVLQSRERNLPEDHPELQNARHNLALTLHQMGDLPIARTLGEQTVEARERSLPADHIDLVSSWHNLALTMYETDEFAIARGFQERVLEARKRSLSDDHPDLLAAMGNLALTMRSMGDLASARSLQERVIAVLEQSLPADHVDLLDPRENLALILFDMGHLARARSLQERVLTARESSLAQDDLIVLRTRTHLANTMDAMGDDLDARFLLEQVLAHYEQSQPDNHKDLIAVRASLASTMHDLGDLVSSRLLYEQILASYESNLPEDHPNLLAVRHNLANCMESLGDLAGARLLKEQVLAAQERSLPEDHPDMLAARGSLASTMDNMGDNAGARLLLEQVLLSYDRSFPEDHPHRLATLHNLANTIFEMGDDARARSLYEQALAVLERNLPEDHPNVLKAKHSLSRVMKRMGENAEARRLLEQVISASERSLPEGHPDLLAARSNLAGTLYRMNDLAGARSLNEQVLAAFEQSLPEDHPRLQSARSALAKTMWAMGERDDARSHISALSLSLQQRTLMAARLSSRGARAIVDSDANKISRLLFLSHSGDYIHRRTVMELIETRRVVSTDGIRSEAYAETDPRIRELRTAARQASESLNTVVMRAAAEELNDTTFASAAFEQDKAQRNLRDALAEHGVHLDAVQSDKLAGVLPKDSVAVGMLAYGNWDQDEVDRQKSAERHLLAHVMHGDGTIARVELGAVDELESLVEQWRGVIGKPIERGVGIAENDSDDERKAGLALRERLLDPILVAAGNEVSTLYLCLDDLAFLVPLDALPLANGVVGDRFRIRLLTSFNELLAPRPAVSGEPSLLTLGGVSYSADGEEPKVRSAVPAAAAPIERSPTGKALPPSFRPLFQTSIEAEVVATLFDRSFETEPKLLEGEDATKAALAEALPGKRYVHLATHGWFAPESVKSMLDDETGTNEINEAFGMSAEQRITGFAPLALCGLALTGANQPPDDLGRRAGILTAQELAGFDLSNCELAVLSACETNVGIRRAGQGIQSLQTALHAAGARMAITSLWKVDDAYARKLMELFYTHLWVDKMSIPDALWRAKKELRDEGAPTSEWAAWVLSGRQGEE